MKRPAIATLPLAAALACADEPQPPPVPARDVAWFLDRLHELDDLPRLEPATAELVSTWDRSGGNVFDGVTYPGVDGDTNVLLDVDGPGCIHRISTGLVDDYDFYGIKLDATFELWLDGERTLALPASDLFDPERSPFAGPLVYEGVLPTLRMPIPFAEHAKIQLISPDEQWGAFWHIGYSRYPEQVAVQTLELPLTGAAAAAFERAGEAWLDSLDGPLLPPDDDLLLVADTLAPGASLVWEDRGCGTIERLELRIDPNWAASWRELQVRVSWDDAAAPAIEMPAHQLFIGSDYGKDPAAEFDSLIVGAAQGRYYMRLPMPYRDAARIELFHAAPYSFDVELALWRRRCDAQPEDFGYLHAHAHVAPAATPDSPRSGPKQIPVHRVLERAGRGKVVGTGLRLYWPYVDVWWGEGDWQVWTDVDFDSWPPTIHGTGTEEFYDGGWTWVERRPLTGAVKQRPGLVTLYGFMLDDAIPFQEQIRLQVETFGLFEGDELLAEENPEWATTVYWYDQSAG